MILWWRIQSCLNILTSLYGAFGILIIFYIMDFNEFEMIIKINGLENKAF